MEQPDFASRTQNNTYVRFDNGKEKEWNGPFFFIQGADTQYGMIESYLEKKADPRWDKEIELSCKLIDAINKMQPKPKFFVICGDLLDAFPDQDLGRRELQERDFKAAFSKLDRDIPLICVCGNHDIGNTPTKETIQRHRSSFGDDYFSFWCNGVFFLVLNSQYYYDSRLVTDLAVEHDNWIDEQLRQIKSSGCKHAIVFQHIPWFVSSADEGGDWMNIQDKEIRLKMLEKFKNAGITSIFCGHYHRNAGGFYGNMEQVVTSAIGAQLGDDTHGVRLVKINEKHLTHKYYGIDELPSIILL